MSVLDITARLCAPPRIRYNYAGELVRIFCLKRRGVATGISNRARRRELRPAAYSNGISLGSFNHWHYGNPDNCCCCGHCRLPRVYYVYNEPRSTWVPRGGKLGPPEVSKKTSFWQVPFFRASRPGYIRPRIFHFEMNLWMTINEKANKKRVILNFAKLGPHYISARINIFFFFRIL